MSQIVIYVSKFFSDKTREGILWEITPKIGFSDYEARPTSHGQGLPQKKKKYEV
jgi:hypothetical protein